MANRFVRKRDDAHRLARVRKRRTVEQRRAELAVDGEHLKKSIIDPADTHRANLTAHGELRAIIKLEQLRLHRLQRVRAAKRYCKLKSM